MGIININYKLENLMLFFIVFFIHTKNSHYTNRLIVKTRNSLKFNIEQVKMKGNNVKQILEIRLTN